MLDPRIQEALVGLVIAIITWAISEAAVAIKKAAYSRFSKDQLELASSIASVAVGAVEQLAASGKITLPKYDEALVMVKDLASKVHITLTDTQWKSMIEAAVAAMKAMGDEFKKGE